MKTQKETPLFTHKIYIVKLNFNPLEENAKD